MNRLGKVNLVRNNGAMTGGSRADASLGGFDTALEYIQQEILQARATAGTRLPGERELAEKLAVSRGAVREALKVLQAQGIITSQVGPGGGTRVAAHPGPAFGRILTLHIALHAVSFDELTDTRVALERVATLAAASSMSDAVLETLENLCVEMASVRDTSAFNDLDTAFHIEIAKAGNNRLVRDLTVAIREAVAPHIVAAEHTIDDWNLFRATLIEDHRRIVDALSHGDGELAAEINELHIRRAHAALLP